MRPTDSNNDPVTVDPIRLFSAADVILAAESKGGTVSMWRDDSRPSREGFSSVELVEALMLLRRLGLIDHTDTRSVRHQPHRS